jgi:hypothetical protein
MLGHPHVLPVVAVSQLNQAGFLDKRLVLLDRIVSRRAGQIPLDKQAELHHSLPVRK